MRTRPGDFTPQADAYARARPGYPRAMVTVLVKLMELGDGDAVAEIGAGTGIFTATLAGRGLRVTAIEPNAEMRSRASEHEGITSQDGSFEETGLAEGSQSWIVAAQAFHWADPRRALPELHRILRPGGSLTVLWNNRDVASSDVLTMTREAIERLVPDFDEGYRARDWAEVLTSTSHFAAPYEMAVPHVVPMTVERYLDLWRSHNLLNSAAGAEGMRALLAELTERLDGLDTVDVPYICRCWTAVAA